MIPKACSIGILALILFSCQTKPAKNKQEQLLVFHAGSLSIPLHAIADSFMLLHPQVNVDLEAAGSVSSVRKITDLNRSCDLIALADSRLIDDWLLPDYADWCVEFASNVMGLVYRPDSPFASEINAQNWHQIIARKEVRYGRSDPDSDPCGYRTLMALKLADLVYPEGIPYEDILKKDQAFIRPKASDLMALLETKSLDYVFEYQSVAGQHGFHFLPFPDSVNLGDPLLADWYRTVEVEIAGGKPGSIHKISGAPMVYGLTIPRNSISPDLATEFVRFLLKEEGGMKLLLESGQRVLPPKFSDKSGNLPDLF